MRPFRSLLLASTLSSATAIMYFKGLNTFVDLDALGLIKDGKATKPVLLSFSNPSCTAEQKDLGFPFEFLDIPDACYEMVQVQYGPETDNELTEFFKPSGCNYFAYLDAGEPLNKFDTLVATTSEELVTFFWDRHRFTGIKLVNDLEESVDVRWEKRFLLNEHHVASIAPGKTQTLDTFMGHTFIFRTTEEGDLLARKVITSRKDLLMSDLVSKECGEHEADCEKSDTETLQRTEHEFKIWRARLATNIGRLRQNEEQPPRLEHYAPVGFKKITVPEPAWAAIQAFYKANKHDRIREPWDEGDTHVNFYESGTTMTYIDDKLRQLVFKSVKPILEEWIGGLKLDPTSCYGIRNYQNGSWLRDHVDIGETHIVSAIINVEQDVDKDWPLMILDHEGNRHMITMQPGDMVLYESATKIHGRPQPFAGRLYANVFTHYRPLSWVNRDQVKDIQDEEENDFVEQL